MLFGLNICNPWIKEKNRVLFIIKLVFSNNSNRKKAYNDFNKIISSYTSRTGKTCYMYTFSNML